MPMRVIVEESDKTSLQTPKGKEDPNDKTSLQTPQGKEVEELPATEPVAIPDDDELKPVDTIVIKDGETYRNVKVYEVKKQAKEQEGAKCQFCKGTGKVIVEKKGIKECPRCEGEGYTSKPQAELEGVKDDQQIDDITQEEEIQGGIQPETEEQIEQGMDQFQQEKPMEKPIEQKPMERKLIDQEPIEEEVEVPEKENVKAFESFVNQKIQVLQQKHPDKAVTLLMGTEMNGDYGSKKIRGTLAYAGVSLNDRIYLPEELAKGDGMTLPLLLNHSSTAGAEAELYRLQDDARQSLERGQDYRVGEVTLTWKPEDLTLYYEGEVENKFFQKEVDEADMAVSLGIYYDSDSPMLCNDQCYTVIKGAEFREVSLVYHAGFPVATIEAYEKLLKNKAMESMKGEPNINPEKANEGVCPRCKGKGITYKAVVTGITKAKPDGDGIGAIKIECPECDGTGEISTESRASEDSETYECPYCEFYTNTNSLVLKDHIKRVHRNRTAGGYDQAPEDRSVNTQGRRHSFGWSNVYPSSESKASDRFKRKMEWFKNQHITGDPEQKSWNDDDWERAYWSFSNTYDKQWKDDGYGTGESKASERWEGVEDVTELDDSDKDEVFAFLFDLRESGETNMWGAGSYVQEEFGFDKNLARDITLEWMKNFKEISRRMGRESKATEWTPSEGHDWEPPTDKDYKDLPKPDKNQKMAGSHDEPKYNRDSDGENIASEVLDFQFHEDAGHGWLEVPKSIIRELGISDQISNYSYQKGDIAYLEEDADMSLFLKAYNEFNHTNILPQSSNYQDPSPIRQYDNYSA